MNCSLLKQNKKNAISLDLSVYINYVNQRIDNNYNWIIYDKYFFLSIPLVWLVVDFFVVEDFLFVTLSLSGMVTVDVLERRSANQIRNNG